MANFHPIKERQIRALVKADQLIHAIKLYREITGVGLAEAKSAVEAMGRGGSVNMPTPPTRPRGIISLRLGSKKYLEERKKIEAIKIYANHTTLG